MHKHCPKDFTGLLAGEKTEEAFLKQGWEKSGNHPPHLHLLDYCLVAQLSFYSQNGWKRRTLHAQTCL